MPVTETRLRILHKNSVKSYYDTFKQPSIPELKKFRAGFSFFNVFHCTDDTVLQEVYKDGDVDALMIHSISDPPPNLEEFDMYQGISIIDFNCSIKYFWAIALLHRLTNVPNVPNKKVSVRFTYQSLMANPSEGCGLEFEQETTGLKIRAVDELRILFEADHYYQSEDTEKLAIDVNIMRILQEGPSNFPNITKSVMEVPSSQKVATSFHNFFYLFDAIKRSGEMSTDYGRNTLKFRCKPEVVSATRARHASASAPQDQNPTAAGTTLPAVSSDGSVLVIDLSSDEDEEMEQSSGNGGRRNSVEEAPQSSPVYSAHSAHRHIISPAYSIPTPSFLIPGLGGTPNVNSNTNSIEIMDVDISNATENLPSGAGGALKESSEDSDIIVSDPRLRRRSTSTSISDGQSALLTKKQIDTGENGTNQNGNGGGGGSGGSSSSEATTIDIDTGGPGDKNPESSEDLTPPPIPLIVPIPPKTTFSISTSILNAPKDITPLLSPLVSEKKTPQPVTPTVSDPRRKNSFSSDDELRDPASKRIRTQPAKPYSRSSVTNNNLLNSISTLSPALPGSASPTPTELMPETRGRDDSDSNDTIIMNPNSSERQDKDKDNQEDMSFFKRIIKPCVSDANTEPLGATLPVLPPVAVASSTSNSLLKPDYIKKPNNAVGAGKKLNEAVKKLNDAAAGKKPNVNSSNKSNELIDENWE